MPRAMCRTGRAAAVRPHAPVRARHSHRQQGGPLRRPTGRADASGGCHVPAHRAGGGGTWPGAGAAAGGVTGHGGSRSGAAWGGPRDGRMMPCQRGLGYGPHSMMQDEGTWEWKRVGRCAGGCCGACATGCWRTMGVYRLTLARTQCLERALVQSLSVGWCGPGVGLVWADELAVGGVHALTRAAVVLEPGLRVLALLAMDLTGMKARPKDVSVAASCASDNRLTVGGALLPSWPCV